MANLNNGDDIDLIKFGSDFYYLGGNGEYIQFAVGDTATHTSYVCSVTQANSDAPVQTVISNTTGISPSWVDEGVGVYSLDFTGVAGTFYSPDITNWTDKAIVKNVFSYDGTETLLGGYFYWWDSGNTKLYLYCFNNIGSAGVELNTLIGSSALYLPEIKFFTA